MTQKQSLEALDAITLDTWNVNPNPRIDSFMAKLAMQHSFETVSVEEDLFLDEVAV